MELTVRPLGREDFNPFVNYWFDLSAAEVERLGVDRNQLPSREQMRGDLETVLATPVTSLGTFILTWCVDEKAIGHSALKEIVYGQSANIHLHMWNADLRGKHFGPQLFCLSALDFYRRFELKEIFCEPKADNPSPNRMLQRIEFPLVGQRTAAASEITAVSALNRYAIKREIAEDYLREKATTAKTLS